MTGQWLNWIQTNDQRRHHLTTRQGWDRFVHQAPRGPLELLSRKAMARLDDDDLSDYNYARSIWNANLPTVKTQQLTNAFRIIDQVMASNLRDSDQQRGNVVIDASPALGKTTIALRYARQFHRATERRFSNRTPDGSVRIPAVFIPVQASTTLKGLNQRLLGFYEHPAVGERSTSQRLEQLAVDCITTCHTQLIIIDDLHFVDFKHRNGMELSNHLKSWSNEMPVTFVYVGVGLLERRFFDEGLDGADAALAQTARRATRCPVVPFTIKSTNGFRAWVELLEAFEKHLMLAEASAGMLSDHAKLLHRRTQGRIGSLTGLLDRACYVAITSGVEFLTEQILTDVPVDNAAHASERTA